MVRTVAFFQKLTGSKESRTRGFVMFIDGVSNNRSICTNGNICSQLTDRRQSCVTYLQIFSLTFTFHWVLTNDWLVRRGNISDGYAHRRFFEFFRMPLFVGMLLSVPIPIKHWCTNQRYAKQVNIKTGHIQITFNRNIYLNTKPALAILKSYSNMF